MFNLDLTASQKNENKFFAFIIEEFIYILKIKKANLPMLGNDLDKHKPTCNIKQT